MPTYNVADTVGFDVVVQPTVTSVVNSPAGAEFEIYLPGPQGPKGDTGDSGVHVGPTPPEDTSRLWIQI